MYLESVYTRSPVCWEGVSDMHLCVLERRGGPSDSIMPRYFMGVGSTRKDALEKALTNARAVMQHEVEYHSV